MNKFLNLVRKYKYIIFFSLIYLVITLFKFWGFLSVEEILPGLDSLSHFYAFREFLLALQSGNFFSYLPEWFGGQPLMHFYPPFAFLFMAFINFLFGDFISLFFIFRWSIFLFVVIFPISFYFFLKEFFNKKVANIGVWFSFLWVFYPDVFSFIGIGISGAALLGLFTQVLSINFLLWYLVILRKIVKTKNNKIALIFWGSIALSLIILTNIVTLIAAFVLTIIFLIYYYKDLLRKKVLYSLSALATLGICLASFWLFPYLNNFEYTSAERIDFSSFVKISLSPFFYFNINTLLNGDFVNFNYAWFFTAILFIIGFIYLIKKKKYLIPLFFTTFFVIFNFGYFEKILIPKIAIHYYRFLAFEFIFYLAIASFGLYILFKKINKKKLFIRISVVLILLSSVFHLAYINNIGEGVNAYGNRSDISSVYREIYYHWQLSDYETFNEGVNVVDYLKIGDLPEEPIRIMSDMEPSYMTNNLSSIHFFNTFIPLINKQPVIAGLYAESSWQLPFIFPVTNNILGNNMKWGDVKDLYFNSHFQSQNINSMLNRLRLFGVNYFIISSNFFDNYETAEKVRKIEEFNRFSIYHIEEARELIYKAKYKPGLFISPDKSIDFRDFALGWYSQPDLLDYPVAYYQKDIHKLNKNILKDFSYVIIALSDYNKENIDYVKSLDIPVIILNSSQESIGEIENIEEITDFRPVSEHFENRKPITPKEPNTEALQELEEFIISNSTPNRENKNSVDSTYIDKNIIKFKSFGPIIINMGYFPYWKNIDGSEVYPVTPGQMLVFADGSEILEYIPGKDAKLGKRLSIIALIVLLGIGGYNSYRKRRDL